MRRLFSTLRNLVEKQEAEATPENPALPGFEGRVEVLVKYAERAAAYEDDLIKNLDQVKEQLNQLEGLMEAALDAGKDRTALEYIRLAARLRPQSDLIDTEIRAFRAVANDLVTRVNTLIEHLDEARNYARTTTLSAAATEYLDHAMLKLTRYFVLLERVATARRNALPQRLAEKMMTIIDDRQLDLELARYVLARRRALGTGKD